MKLTGSRIVAECLLEQGVDTVFGYPGGTILNIYDALYDYQDKIHHVLTSHEQGAAHAADGYARSTGKVGVCMATSGPGATNLITGIATAYMDSIPMIAITCNQDTKLLGKDSFQEVDTFGMTMPITKHNFIIKDVKDLAPTIRKAFHIARSGRPGPVAIDIAKDVTAATYEYTKEEINVKPEMINRYSEADIDLAIDMIKAAQRPFIMVGGGTISSESSPEVKELVYRLHAPICDTLMGKGAFDNTDKHYTGMIGMHGTKTTNYGVSKSDLLIVIGARFSDRVTGNTKTFAKNAKIIQIDIDPVEINKNIKVDHAIIGNAKQILRDILAKLPAIDHSEWLALVRETMVTHPVNYDHNILTGPMVVEKLDELTNGNAIVVTEVGQNQMWAAQYYKFKYPRQLITSGGLGTMGYGLGAMIGARFGNPNVKVVNIAGDGCFRMNLNELATACRNHLPVVEIILNNQVLGMVRQWQTLFYHERYSATILDDGVDFCKISEGFGCTAIRVKTPSDLEPALKEALAGDHPYVIECMIGEDDKVWPMVAPGGAIAEAFSEEDLNK